MGSSNWNASAYTSYSRSVSNKTQQQIFTNRSGCHPDLDPSKFEIRESVDSQANPNSTPIIVAVDETGSMGQLAVEIIKKGLGVIVEEVVKRKPVTDPHILLAAVGDGFCDESPIQVTQFEADTVIIPQIEKFYLEGNGGGNGGESYGLIWWFANNRTVCDAINLHNRKGYLFTIGDESCHREITKEQINHFLGGQIETDISAEELLRQCQEHWNVFHLITPTSATDYQDAISKWRELLGERAMIINDWRKLGELIVSTIQINEGQDKNKVLSSWDDDTNLVVANATKNLPASSKALPNDTKTKVEEI